MSAPEVPRPKVGSSGYDILDSIHIGATLANGDLQTGVAIKALLQGGIVTGELELVMPFELQCHGVECLRC
jgi:hypothetical protein